MFMFTNETEILELRNKILCTEENARSINIDYKTMQELRYQNWYLVNGQVYYGKDLMDRGILNYLLCEKIANTIYQLETAHFVPAKIGYKTGLASLNFRKSNVNYFYANQEYFPFDSPIQTLQYLSQFFSISNDEGYHLLVHKILKLISFHIYTDLRDLIDCNLLFQEEENGFSLAPLYDFDFAFENGIINKYYYKSSISHFALPSEDLEKVLQFYPNFRNDLLLILEIDMEKVLEEITKENHLEISDIFKEHFLKQDKIKKDFIRSLHL